MPLPPGCRQDVGGFSNGFSSGFQRYAVVCPAYLPEAVAVTPLIQDLDTSDQIEAQAQLSAGTTKGEVVEAVIATETMSNVKQADTAK